MTSYNNTCVGPVKCPINSCEAVEIICGKNENIKCMLMPITKHYKRAFKHPGIVKDFNAMVNRGINNGGIKVLNLYE